MLATIWATSNKLPSDHSPGLGWGGGEHIGKKKIRLPTTVDLEFEFTQPE